MSDVVAMPELMLTTTDNPFNPFTQFEEWNSYDEQQGHYTNSYLARVLVDSEELGEVEQAFSFVEAIVEILDYNINGLYAAIERKPDGTFEIYEGAKG